MSCRRGAMLVAIGLICTSVHATPPPRVAVADADVVALPAQGGQPGAGTVTVFDQFAMLELAPEAVLPENLLDLEGTTIRYTPDGGAYVVESVPLVWDGNFGTLLAMNGWPSEQVFLGNFAFPFAGQAWSSLYVNAYGNITFGADQSAFYDVDAHRFLVFREYGASMTAGVPIIGALFRRLGGAYGWEMDPQDVNQIWVKQLADRVVVTWSISEPYFELQTFTSVPRLNRFQAVLHESGVIELSYDDLQVEDGIVGVFAAAVPHRFPIDDPVDPGLPEYIDVLDVTVLVESADTVRVTFEMRGDLLPEGDPTLANLVYRAFIDLDPPYVTGPDFKDPEFSWEVGATPQLTYTGVGPGVDSEVEVDGNRVTLRAATSALGGAEQFGFFVDVVDFDDPGFPFDQTAGRTASIPAFAQVVSLPDPVNATLPEHIDLLQVTGTQVGATALQFTFDMRGPIPPPDDPTIDALVYRVWIDVEAPFMTGIDFNDADITWEIVGSPQGYYTAGPSIYPDVLISGKKISFMASATPLAGLDEVAFFVDTVDFDAPGFPFDQAGSVVFSPPQSGPSLVDLSAQSGTPPASQIAYEAFYYRDIPSITDLGCAVIDALGDRFDFFCFYTDFRIDRQEAGAVSTGRIGDLVTGVIPKGWEPAQFCSPGQLQCCQFPLYIGAPIAAPSGQDFSGPYDDYNRQIALISHELGHRWLTTSEAIVGGRTVQIGTVHWVGGLHTPVAFTIEEQFESSMMAGRHWQDNGNGTFTNLSQPFFQSAGYSYLDLYLMGFLPAEAVPDFFLIENLQWVGGSTWSGDRLDVTIADHIAAHGERLPPFEQSQRDFNTGLVGIVPPGAAPSSMLLERMAGIREQWNAYWPVATGGVSTMTSDAAVLGDLDGDGAVGIADFLELLSLWGPCPAPCPPCHADLDGDCNVGIGDFLLLLASWG